MEEIKFPTDFWIESDRLLTQLEKINESLSRICSLLEEQNRILASE